MPPDAPEEAAGEHPEENYDESNRAKNTLTRGVSGAAAADIIALDERFDAGWSLVDIVGHLEHTRFIRSLSFIGLGSDYVTVCYVSLRGEGTENRQEVEIDIRAVRGRGIFVTRVSVSPARPPPIPTDGSITHTLEFKIPDTGTYSSGIDDRTNASAPDPVDIYRLTFTADNTSHVGVNEMGQWPSSPEWTTIEGPLSGEEGRRRGRPLLGNPPRKKRQKYIAPGTRIVVMNNKGRRR